MRYSRTDSRRARGPCSRPCGASGSRHARGTRRVGLRALAPFRDRQTTRVRLTLVLTSASIAVQEVPFDLAEVKLVAPSIRPGTVAKADVIGRLCTAGAPVTTLVAGLGTGRRPCWRGGRRLIRVRLRGSRWTGETATPSCSCDTSRPRSTVSSRSRARSSTRCPGRGHRAGRHEFRVSGEHWLISSARWCWCSTICTL